MQSHAGHVPGNHTCTTRRIFVNARRPTGATTVRYQHRLLRHVANVYLPHRRDLRHSTGFCSGCIVNILTCNGKALWDRIQRVRQTSRVANAKSISMPHRAASHVGEIACIPKAPRSCAWGSAPEPWSILAPTTPQMPRRNHCATASSARTIVVACATISPASRKAPLLAARAIARSRWTPGMGR